MNLRRWQNRIQGIAWAQVLLVLLLTLPCLSVGEWRCEDGRPCPECNAVCGQDHHEDCGCPDSGYVAADCHSCCTFVAFTAPAGNKSRPPSPVPTPVLALPVPEIAVVVAPAPAVPIPASSSALPMSHAPPLASPRAPPA